MSLKPISEIKRYPLKKNDLLQGWDSADELMLQHLAQQDLTAKRILLVNDQFGALSCGSAGQDSTTYSDSYISHMGIKFNSNGQIKPLSQLKDLKGYYDFVFIQIPKSMSFFEDILCHLTHHLHTHAKVICGAMLKHLAPSSFDLLQKYIGATSTSLAHKKARLVFASFERCPVPSPFPVEVKLDGFDIPFIHHSNLFSRDKLDIGTRFFLEHLPRGNYRTILDLGCANGVIGIKAKMLNPDAVIHFSDESALAIESARLNYQSYFNDQAYFHWTNCFEGQPEKLLDLVLCNPPFHQGNTIGDFIAWQMFQDAYKSLKVGGTIRVIGNSHLGYQIKLKKIFGNSQIIATNKKFIICESIK